MTRASQQTEDGAAARPASLPGGREPSLDRRAVQRGDVVAAGAAMVLLAVAAVVGGLLYLAGRPVEASTAPLYARWLPHAGPGTPLALTVAALVIWYGPVLSRRLSWRSLRVVGYAAAVGWTLGLALVDGWRRGLAGRLTTTHEYLHEVPGITDVSAAVRGFSGRILDFQPDSWTTHVAGHPPGALLVFLWLDRAGLGGGGWAAIACVLIGATAAVTVPETVRLLSGNDEAARAAVPFAVLFPGAVWIGASADGLFAGVTAVGVMLIARRGALSAVAGGALLTFGIYLSYGLVLLLPVVVVVLILRRAWWRAGLAMLGGAGVVIAFTASGFWWLDGYHLVVERYYQGVASVRPYAYWVWANLAAVVASGGPAAAVILRRAVGQLVRARSGEGDGASVRGGSAGEHDVQSGALARGAGSGRGLDAVGRVSAGAGAGGGAAGGRGGVVRVVLERGGKLLRGGGLGAACLLPVAAGVAILFADLSGLSKAETERIWLPFTVWFAAGAGLVPVRSRRVWLVGQAAIALLVNHLLLTSW